MSGPHVGDPARLVTEMEGLIDQVVELGAALDLFRDEDALGPEPPAEDGASHRKRARLALVLIDMRDKGERLVAQVGDGPAPAGLDSMMTRLMSVLAALGKLEECRVVYDSVQGMLRPESSAWHLAEAVTIMINAYLAKDRYEEAIALYRRELARLEGREEAAIGLIRAAFYLVSRLVMSESMEPAREIYDTMERFGGGRASLTLVAPGPAAAPASKPELSLAPAPAPAPEPEDEDDDDEDYEGAPLPESESPGPQPILTLVGRPGSPGLLAGGPDAEEDEHDYIGIVRAQAAVNVISGYAMTGQTDKAQEVYRSMPDPDDVEEYVNLRSMASVNLVCAFIRNRRWDRAMGALDEIRELGRLGDNAVYLAKAVVEIIGYTEDGRLDEARRLYESLEGLSDSPEFNLERMRAAGNLVYAAGEHGDLELARRIYDTLPSFGESRETLLVRTAATINLMSDYCACALMAEAEGLFKILESFESIPEVVESKAQGAFNLMCCHVRKRRFKTAEELYARIKTIGDGGQIKRMMAHATFGLVTEYLKVDNFEAALKAYGYFRDFDLTLIFLLERVKAMYNLVQYCCERGLRTLARGLYREYYDLFRLSPLEDSIDDDKSRMDGFLEVGGDVFGLIYQDLEPAPEDPETELREFLSDAGSLLVSQFAQNMGYKEAGEVLETLKELSAAKPAKPVVGNALQASFEMIVYLVGDGRLKQAMRIFEQYDEFPDDPEVADMVREQRIQSGLHIIENTGSLQRISLLFDRLSEYASLGKYGHYLGQAALRYGEALCEARDFVEARRVYERLTTFGESKRVQMCRLQLAVLLLEHYLAAGDRESAESLYPTFKRVGRSRQVVKLRDRAVRMVEKILKLDNVISKKDQPEPQGALAPGIEPGGEGRGRGLAGRSEDN